MAYVRFGPCPHCQTRLTYLEDAAGSKLNPHCPACDQVVTVPRATFLMRDRSCPRPRS
jgi:hypothetical protein